MMLSLLKELNIPKCMDGREMRYTDSSKWVSEQIKYARLITTLKMVYTTTHLLNGNTGHINKYT